MFLTILTRAVVSVLDQFNPVSALFLDDLFYFILPTLPGSPSSISVQDFCYCTNFSYSPFVLHVLPIIFDSRSNIWCCVQITDFVRRLDQYFFPVDKNKNYCQVFGRNF
jgi:hypothetical protein